MMLHIDDFLSFTTCIILYRKKLKGEKKTTVNHYFTFARLTKRTDSIDCLWEWGTFKTFYSSWWQYKLEWPLRERFWYYLTYFINFKMTLFPHFNTFDIEMHLTVTISQAAGMTHRSLPVHVNLIPFPDGLIKQLRPINISVHKPWKDHLRLE